MSRTLESLVRAAARRTPEAIAVVGPDETLTYGALSAQADRAAAALRELGVREGDRVGLWVEKGARAVVMMQAALRLGAVYVPLDPLSPPARIATIVADCGMRVLCATGERLAQLPAEGPGTGAGGPRHFSFDAGGELRYGELARFADLAPPPHGRDENAPAYVLYTSGSTGVPKGVCISHLNALAFVDWVVETLQPTGEDRFANHAPFFFDLSVLDLYVAFSAGAQVHVVPELAAFNPRGLVEFIRSREISVWYSVPSALMLMIEQGALLEEPLEALRTVFFAGEPFPIGPLRRLRERYPRKRLLNLYGPTETNVCTAYEVKALSADRITPVPIGRACSGDRVWLEPLPQEEAAEWPSGAGELCVEGPTVMLGYWGRPPHQGPYRTGDVVSTDAAGDFVYHGRIDNMVKVRGRRIELGEIEAALGAHPGVSACCVVVRGAGPEATLVAFLAGPEPRPSLIELKRHLAARVPRYMIVDAARWLEALPRTRNGKVDRRALQAQAV